MLAKFQNIINSNKPVLVDFYTDWCVPCKLVHPVLKQVKQDLKGNVKIIKVNVDKNPFIASQFKIKTLPTIIVFKNGKPYWTHSGICDASEIKSVITEQSLSL